MAALALCHDDDLQLTDDSATLLAHLEMTAIGDAEISFESFYPGEVVPEKGLRILADIFEVGLPSAPASPTSLALGR